MPLFGKSQKSPEITVRSLKDAVTALERGDKKAEKAQEDVSKNLVSTNTTMITLLTFSQHTRFTCIRISKLTLLAVLDH